MTTSVVFDLVGELVTQFDVALPTINVLDFTGNLDDPGDFLMVGVEDPDVEGFAESADSQQSWTGLGARARDEEGTISCCAVSWNGDGDPRAARAAVKAIVAAVENHLRSDPNLGGSVPGLIWTGFGVRHVLQQVQSTSGAGVLFFFQIAFKARI